jgi:hypothetical protein
MMIHHHVSSTYTSECYHHLVFPIDTFTVTHWHAIIICEFDMHIGYHNEMSTNARTLL